MLKKLCGNKSAGLLVLRVFVGVIFLVHGIQKLLHMDGTTMFFGQVGLNSFWAWVVAIVETLGGALIILGAFTTYASSLLAIVLLGAIYFVKWKFSGPTALEKFAAAEIELALLGAVITLAIAGAGRYSILKFCRKHKTGEDCKVCSIAGCENNCDSCGDASSSHA